ncbi:hypothetical protein [Salininema proteolyticum]|uniref:Uncharacterized protein n=1 Tax=Salininema proteolyticum TaxID=1607685 RepID=A0ABV8TYW9_9ACTN
MIAGDGPAPSLVLLLIEALPEEALTRAIAAGNEGLHGWDASRFLLADIYDAINLNTRATGNWKKSPPTIPHWPRPKPRQAREQAKRVTVADLHARFTAGPRG